MYVSNIPTEPNDAFDNAYTFRICYDNITSYSSMSASETDAYVTVIHRIARLKQLGVMAILQDSACDSFHNIPERV